MISYMTVLVRTFWPVLRLYTLQRNSCVHFQFWSSNARLFFVNFTTKNGLNGPKSATWVLLWCFIAVIQPFKKGMETILLQPSHMHPMGFLRDNKDLIFLPHPFFTKIPHSPIPVFPSDSITINHVSFWVIIPLEVPLGLLKLRIYRWNDIS